MQYPVTGDLFNIGNMLKISRQFQFRQDLHDALAKGLTIGTALAQDLDDQTLGFSVWRDFLTQKYFEFPNQGPSVFGFGLFGYIIPFGEPLD